MPAAVESRSPFALFPIGEVFEDSVAEGRSPELLSSDCDYEDGLRWIKVDEAYVVFYGRRLYC